MTTNKEAVPRPWLELQDTQRLLADYIAGLLTASLEQCRAMVNADPRFIVIDTLHYDAGEEVKRVIADARARLADPG